MDEVLSWIESNRKQAEVIRYLVALGGSDDARASLSLAQADALDATADGWQEIVDSANNAG